MLSKSTMSVFTRFKRKFLFKFYSSFLVEIDVVIPVHKKDLIKLSFVIDGIRSNSINNIGNIFVVGEKNQYLEAECKRLHLEYVDENELNLPKKESLGYITNSVVDRNGWLFQQLIKLHADIICKNEYILLLDSDTVFLKPVVWVNHKRRVNLFISDEYHLPYGVPLLLYFPNKIRYLKSFVSHQILTSKSILNSIRMDVEEETGLNFTKAVLNSIDINESSAFSEYELIGNYMYWFKNDEIIIRYWKNKSLLFDEDVNDIKNQIATFQDGRFISVSFHNYNKTN